MNQHWSGQGHLSEQQIDEWLIGQRPEEVESHLRTCQSCAGELARLAQPLSEFSGAVRNWSEQQMGATGGKWRVAAAPRWGWRAGLAVAALWLAFATPVYRERQATRQAALNKAQDEILLRQIQRELSQSVPAPMEPLAKLMSNDLSR